MKQLIVIAILFLAALTPTPGPQEKENWQCPLDQCVAKETRVFNTEEGHTGLDLEACDGSPVYATKSGVVFRAGEETCGGDNCAIRVMIKHDDGYYSGYWHLSDVFVEEGDNVRTGQPIGITGMTGFTTFPHLHFSIRDWKDYYPPRQYIDVVLAKDHLVCTNGTIASPLPYPNIPLHLIGTDVGHILVYGHPWKAH